MVCIPASYLYTYQSSSSGICQGMTLADHVVLADIYAARETDNLGISSKDLQKQIQELGTPCEYFPTFDEIESFLLKSCAHG